MGLLLGQPDILNKDERDHELVMRHEYYREFLAATSSVRDVQTDAMNADAESEKLSALCHSPAWASKDIRPSQRCDPIDTVHSVLPVGGQEGDSNSLLVVHDQVKVMPGPERIHIDQSQAVVRDGFRI